MSKLPSIASIKALLHEVSSLEDERYRLLLQDERKGVQQALRSFENRIVKQQQRQQQFQAMQHFERMAYQEGATLIAGVDEVGRGPLAGPVVAAAVILPKGVADLGFDDSKKLSSKKRKEVYRLIQEYALAIGVGIVDAETIDRVNIYEASRLAMQQAVSELQLTPDYLLIDAMKINSNTPQIGIIKGDAKSISIAAASIVAKEVRDHMMEEFDSLYPGYDFDNNAGYGTAKHLSALEQLGVTPIHRTTFAPVKKIIK